MTKGELERLAVLEAVVERIESKLDDALVNKADRTTVDDLCHTVEGKVDTSEFIELLRLIMAVLASSAGVLVSTVLGLIVYIWLNR